MLMKMFKFTFNFMFNCTNPIVYVLLTDNVYDRIRPFKRRSVNFMLILSFSFIFASAGTPKGCYPYVVIHFQNSFLKIKTDRSVDEAGETK